ncbi:MAG: nucleotidyltransferase, partial [Chloroflexi bacterium]|nr:nucleotidyltransferase [Chloroflexota bacterium]
MSKHIRSVHPRVSNPVNPQEDFADRWGTAEGRALQLEQNFHNWLTQARADFGHVAKPKDRGFFEEQAQQKFGARI